MRAFADLLERLVHAPRRSVKLALMEAYFRSAPDPDRGWALAALAGELRLPSMTPAVIRGVAEDRVDPVLFRLSHDFVGDLAETAALIWPEPDRPPGPPPALREVVAELSAATKLDRPRRLAALLDRLDPSARFALIKLGSGGLRVGVSARLARTALAETFGRPLERIEELWFALEPPYGDLFRWLEGGAEPQADLSLAFRPMLLANPLEAPRLDALAPRDHAAEIKWDGIRVQAAATARGRRLYSRTGEDISAAFPDLVETMTWRGCVDGELLIAEGPGAAPRPFSDLQARLGRKRPTAKMITDLPALIRVYDLLHDGEVDLRPLPWSERRARLEAWMAAAAPARLDLSPLQPFESWEDLSTLREASRAEGQEGLMIKRRDAPYAAGRPVGPWWKWKRDPLIADCVMMYAQRGHGKRSSYYSDYTFGAWRDGAEGPELAPVGKAYSGYTDEELTRLDRWVRANMTDRYGPVRGVAHELVLEVAFDAVQLSSRHRSGVALRFPRIRRIRWDKPAHEADRVETLRALIPPAPPPARASAQLTLDLGLPDAG